MATASEIVQVLEAWYPKIEPYLTEHDSLPAHKQVEYRVAQARSGNWELAVAHVIRGYYDVAATFLKVGTLYEDVPNAAWAINFKRLTQEGEKRLSARARNLATTMPQWTKSITAMAIEHFLGRPIKAVSETINAVQAIHTAISLALLDRSAQYLSATSQTYQTTAMRDFFESTLPTLEVTSVQNWAISTASKLLGDSQFALFIIDLARQGLEALNARSLDFEIVVKDQIDYMEQASLAEIDAAVYTSQLGIILGTLETVLDVLNDIQTMPRDFASGLRDKMKAAKKKSEKKRGPQKDILNTVVVDEHIYDRPILFPWEKKSVISSQSDGSSVNSGTG